MDVFAIRDLRERTGDLIRGAEAGKLSLVTKHGQPVFVAVPFDDTLLQEGVRVALAVKLSDDNIVSLRQAARIAGLALDAMIDELAKAGVSVVRYQADELDQELSVIGRHADRR